MRLAANLAALPVLAALLATAARAQTAETLAPASNHPDSTTNVSGTGFGADEAVDIYFDTTDEQLAVTGSNGAFPATPIAVPASALPGTHYITAIGRRSGDAAQKAFAVRTNWPKFGEGNHNQGANLFENVLGPSTISGLDLLWNVDTGSYIDAAPAIYNGNLYIGTWGGDLDAVNATSGAKVWTANPGSAMGSPTVSGTLVYVENSVPATYAYNLSNGTLQWSYPGIGNYLASPVVANGIAYVGGPGMYALNASTGALIWRVQPGNLSSYVNYAPAVANGLVYWTEGAILYASNAATGAQVWSAAVPGGNVASTPMVANGAVYIGGGSGNLYAYSAREGSLLWTADTSSVSGSAAAANGLIYVCGFDSDCYGLSPLNGSVVWSYTAPGYVYGTPTVANGIVYLPSNDSIIALNAYYGTVLWSTTSSGLIGSAAVIANGMLYFGSADGNFYGYAIGAGGTAKIKPPSIAALRALRLK
jgi:outer membrane protein assembly factor BamB